MTRIVGHQQRGEFILDPQEAMRRGRMLDRMLSSARLPRAPMVLHATHARLNELDDQISLDAARRLNSEPRG